MRYSKCQLKSALWPLLVTELATGNRSKWLTVLLRVLVEVSTRGLVLCVTDLENTCL